MVTDIEIKFNRYPKKRYLHYFTSQFILNLWCVIYGPPCIINKHEIAPQSTAGRSLVYRINYYCQLPASSALQNLNKLTIALTTSLESIF